ncbi:MAG: hypothetical protein ACRC8P_00950 [Spiroplasma sp.]
MTSYSTTGIITIIGIVILFTPLYHNIGFVNVPAIFFAYLAAVIIVYFS